MGGLRLVMMLAVGALVLIGLMTIRDSGHLAESNRQMIFLGVGLATFAAVNLVHYRWLGQISYFLFGLTLVLLVLVLVGKYLGIRELVPAIRGACRWIYVIPTVDASRVQPSELAKLTYIAALAWYLRQRSHYRNLSGLIAPFALTMLPMALILLEPDLGTVMLFLPVLFAMLFVAGARVKHLLTIILVGLGMCPLFYLKMEPYQRERIEVLLRQNDDNPYWLRGPGYQLRQSKIYIATGGVAGKTEETSTFVKYRPLPDRHNDFIFALISHQWGLVGVILLLILYGLVLTAAVEIASTQVDPFGRLLAIGIATLLAAQMFINVGMTMGIMPVTGMTLPFVSYGGSGLVSNFIAVGLLFNVARHRPHRLARHAFEFDIPLQ